MRFSLSGYIRNTFPFNVLVPSVVQPIKHPVLFWKIMPMINLRDFCIAAWLFGDLVDKDQYHAREFLKKGSVVIDGGANVGIFSGFAQLLGADVYAFEPRKEAFDILSRKSVHVFNKGLGEANSTLTLHKTRDLGGASFEEIGREIGSQSVEVVTIDSLNLPRVDFIKLDTEGYEGHILKGAAETIKRCKPIIAMSAYHHPEDKEELPKILKSILPYRCELSTRAEEDFICTPL